ncbi:hypothetical protein BT96DRAFT_945953 [Gymnopus androsaceus JB14]|uniref:Uncharacterized protein n=1 Tax=Gymnopus androsaceus JB14 TaxID=1447944 RepID=A0A6A4GZ04_9AGAR|nr:hypothetical protein BT96DRAFT_945953 [Gymnopus androsaceus JB14]
MSISYLLNVMSCYLTLLSNFNLNTMADKYYKVAFICQAFIKKGEIGWQTKDKTNESVTSVAFYGASFYKPWFSIVVNVLASGGINGYKFYQHLNKDQKEICKSETIQTVLTCPTRAWPQENFSHWIIAICIGPCCRQTGYLIATEWVFIQDKEARDKHKKEYQKERNWMTKAKAKEQKLV